MVSAVLAVLLEVAPAATARGVAPSAAPVEAAEEVERRELSVAELEAATRARETEADGKAVEAAEEVERGELSVAELEAATSARETEAAAKAVEAAEEVERGEFSVAELEAASRARETEADGKAVEAAEERETRSRFDLLQPAMFSTLWELRRRGKEAEARGENADAIWVRYWRMFAQSALQGELDARRKRKKEAGK